jgi:adenylate cyclase
VSPAPHASGDDPEVLRTAGYALAHLAGENDAALDALDRAISLNPNFAQAYGQRGLVLTYLNRPDEAILSAQRAIRLSPFDPGVFAFFFALALAHHAAGRYEAALPWADRSLRDNGGAPPLRLKLSLCGHLGRTKEAEDCLHRLHEIHPKPTIAAALRDLPSCFSPEILARYAEGWRNAGLPEG